MVLNLTFPSPYSDMALLPILAFFFCSAGPFLFLLFAVKEAVRRVQGREGGKEGEEEGAEQTILNPVSSPHVVKFHRVSRGQTETK